MAEIAETSESSKITKERIRKINWLPKDEILLVEEVKKRESLLFGKLDGSGRTAGEKTKAWKEIADLINAGNTTAQRSVVEIKKKYQNIKQKAKEKRSANLHPKTGGGKRPPSPTASEQLLLDGLEGRPSLCGLPCGFDTADPVSIEVVCTPSGDREPVQCTSSEFDPTPTDETSSAFTSSYSEPPSKKQKVTTGALLEEELINIKEKRKLIKEQEKLVLLQQQHMLLKVKQLDPFFDVNLFFNEV